MRIHVVGLGAVGSFVAFHLRRTLSPKHAVVALHRRSTAPIISQIPNGRPIILEVDGITHTQQDIEHVAYAESPERTRQLLTSRLASLHQRPDYQLALDRHSDQHELPPVSGAIESLIVTTKAYAVPAVIAALRGHLSRDSTVVLLHNGMGMYEKLVQDFYPDPFDRPNFILGTNTHGLWRKNPMHTVHAGVGDIRLGIVPDPLGRDFESAVTTSKRRYAELSLNDIANVSGKEKVSPRYLSLRNTIAALTTARALGATWRPFDDVQTAMRRKLVVNSFINPISALMQCKNGDILSSPHSLWLSYYLCAEAEKVFEGQIKAETRRLQEAYDARPEEDKVELGRPIEPPIPSALTRVSLRHEIERVVEQTKDNYSSMYWDVKLGQPSEIKYMNGYLIRLARLYGVRAPVIETLYSLIEMRSAIPLVGKP